MTLSSTFAHILESNRARFNAKFAEARHVKSTLKAEAFKHHLQFTLAPVVEAVYQHSSDTANTVADALYDLSLDLVGQELLGPDSRYPVLVEGWQTLLPRVPRFVGESPRAFVGAITNALYNLSATPGARPHEWLEMMSRAVNLCPEAATFLKVGQVAAWRAGLAHYRSEALALATQLANTSPRLVRLALNLPTANTKTAPLITTLLARLIADPWHRPESPPNPQSCEAINHPQLQIVARVGAFRGFGGLLVAPPLVFSAGEHFIVTDGHGSWLLTADCFGATWHRTPAQPVEGKQTAPFAINRKGEVSVNNKPPVHFPEFADASSWAANPTTLAVTTTLSHAVYLVAVTA